MRKEIHRCHSLNLFQTKNRESLQKLKKRSKDGNAVPLFLKGSTPSFIKILPKQQKSEDLLNPDPKVGRNSVLRIKTSQSHSKSKDKSNQQSSCKSRIKSSLNHNNSKEKLKISTEKTMQRPVTRQMKSHKTRAEHFGQEKARPSLKIERAEDFKSMIPQKGFVESKQQLDMNIIKSRNITLSAEGVLQKTPMGWQFKSLSSYQAYLRTISRLVSLQYFKNFYKVRIFNKWKCLTLHTKKHNILKYLSHTLTFNPNNITLVLLQKKILSRLANKHFVLNINQERDSVEKDDYNDYLFGSIRERLKQIKLNSFEEFFMELIINLRKIIQDHETHDKGSSNFKLSDLAFEDYFIRKNIQDHQTILLKFIYSYQQFKIDIIFQLLEEVLARIKYNIDKWNSNFRKDFTLFDAINAEFSQARSEQLDYNCFSHQTKIKQIIIHIQAREPISLHDLNQISQHLVNKLIEQAKEYLREKYQSGFHCNSQLSQLNKNLLLRKIISERQYTILDTCLKRVDTYCFAEYFKRVNVDASTQIQKISEIIKQNLSVVVEATALIQNNFLSIINQLISTEISYRYDYCSYIEKLAQNVAKIPLRLKMGMYCLDLQATTQYYTTTIKTNYSIILNECLKAFEQRISSIDAQISRFDSHIQISSWSIHEFICSFKHSKDYNFYFQNSLRDNHKELDSILMTIHRVQPRLYEQSYLELFHCKGRSEVVRSKSLCFLREITYKLNYLVAEKQKRVVNISNDINKIQMKMIDLVTSQSIDFEYAVAVMDTINQELQVQGKEIQELMTFIDIEKSHVHKETKQIQFLTYDKLQNQVALLLKLLMSYKQFQEFLNRQLQRDYSSFRLQLLVDCIQKEVAKIKQSIRFLHNYQKFLVNISAYYQAENTKVRLLRLIMQLQIQDLLKLDKKNFTMYQKYTAKQMLQYVRLHDKNQNIIKLFLEEKEYTIIVKEKVMTIETKMAKFLLINSTQDFDEIINPDLNNFIQMLQRNQSQLEDYIKNQHLKELRIQIYDFLSLLRKSIRFLSEYVCIFELYTHYQGYLKKPPSQERVVNKFLNMFKEQSKELTDICEKWWQLNIGIRQLNLKSIIELKYELQIERIYTLQGMIKIEISKINQYLNKRIEEFPLFNLLPTDLLVNAINQPLLFLQYIHSTAKEVYWQHTQYTETAQKSSIIIKTIYGQKLIIPLQETQKCRLKQDEDETPQRKMLKLQLQSCMSEISSIIKNSILNLITNSFQNYMEIVFPQKIPLQAILTSDQINNHNALLLNKNVAEVTVNIKKQIQIVITYKDRQELSRYEMLLIDTLILSKLEFKNKIEHNNEGQILEWANLQKEDDEIYLNLNMDSIKLDYSLIDPMHYTAVEPINYRTFLKLYQSILQIKSSFLFQPYGLQNLAARLMKHLFIITDDKITFQTATNLSSKESILFYFKSSPHQTQTQFIRKVALAYSTLNNAFFQRQEKIKAKAGSMKSFALLKPMFYIQIPVSLYLTRGKNMNGVEGFYRELSVQQRFAFRVIEFYQPSIAILLNICLLHENLNLDAEMQCTILEELLIYKNNQLTQNNYILDHKDLFAVIKNITKSLSFFEKIENQTIKIAFRILSHELSIDDIQRQSQKKKTIIFRNRSLNAKLCQPILKWQQTKLNEEFVKFSKNMDQAFQEQDCIMVVGKPCTGKSYMIKLYHEMVNLQVHSERAMGRLGGPRLLKLEGVDLSMLPFDPEYAANQVRLICKESKQKQTPTDSMWLIWFQGLQRLQNGAIQQILHKNWLVSLNQIEWKLVVQLSNMDNLSPKTALSYRQIIVRERSFSVLQIIHLNKQEIMYLLSDSILHKVIDPFTVFYKIIKDLFSLMRKITPKVFIVPYEEQMIAIHTFQLLIGIINHKSPKIVQHFQTLKENDKIQTLRKLFAFCFLWITSSLVEEGASRKFQEAFLQLCKKEQIDIQNIGSNYIINHKSELIEYVPLKSAKNTLLKAEQPMIINNSVFVQTYQSIILSNLLLFITCNSHSKVLLFGENQTGKTALLSHFTSASKNYRHFYYISSLYTYSCLQDFNRALKERNSVYEREKVELMLREQRGKQMKWHMKLGKTKCVFVQNIAMDLWRPCLGYFKYVSAMERILVEGEICQFRNLHLLLQRNAAQRYIPEEQHFLRIRINYDEGYFSEVFYGIYELISKNCSINQETCYQILKIKGGIVKNLLLLMKMIGKKVKHSIKAWTYFYNFSTLKHILEEMKNKEFRSKGEFLEGLFQEIEFQLYRRMKDEGSKVTLYKLLENCRQHIKEDLREDFILEEPSYLRTKEEEIIQKLTNYLEYKNQFKNLKKSKTLISNLTQFYQALNKKPLIVLNCCSIPGVGPFLPVAVEILGLQLIEVSTLQQFKLVTSQYQRGSLATKSEDITLYHIPSWVVRNQQVLAFLSNKIRNLQYSVRVRRNKRLSQILGTTANQNKCFFIIEYSDKLEQHELNILRFHELMKSATFLQLEQPVRNEQLQELSQFLGKEREELNVRENQTIINKIKRIYEIFQNQQLFKQMSPSIYQYLFSIQNYFRFIKIIIDTYFQRKYEIKSSLSQLQLSIVSLEQFIQEYRTIKGRNNELKGLFNESRKRIAAINESYNSMNDYLCELNANHKYLSLKEKKCQIVVQEKLKKKMLHREQSLLENIENYKAIPRMEIANLKSLYNNNQFIVKGLFQTLSLLISDGDDPLSIKHTILDINLNLRIKQINLSLKREQTIRAVQQRLATLEQEEYKVCYNLFNWLKYSIEYYNFKRELQEMLESIAKVHMEAFENKEAIEIEANIQKVNVEIEENRERLEKEKVQFRQIETNLKESEGILKNLSKFSEIQHFKQKCEKEREYLQQEQKYCLQSSIFFSINLNFIFPADVHPPQYLTKGKQKQDSFRSLMERLFVRWCTDGSKEIALSFFRDQIHRVFENKQKYQFIDKEFDSEDGNLVIAKCKKIGNVNFCIDHRTHENKDVDLFIPQDVYNKLAYISYILSIRYNTNSILLVDPFATIYKYLAITYAHRVSIKRNYPKHEANRHWQDGLQVVAYLLKQHESVILDSTHNILFVQLPPSAQQITFTQNKRQLNGMGGFLLKINNSQFILPFYDSMKVIYVCRQLLLDSEAIQKFYCIHFQENQVEGLQLINHEILKHHLNKMGGSCGLFNSMKQSTNIVLSEIQIRRLVTGLKKERAQFYMGKKEKSLMSQIVQKTCANQENDNVSITSPQFLGNILGMIEQWRAASKESTQIMLNLIAIREYSQRVIHPYSELFLQIYRVCLAAMVKVGGGLRDRNHESFTYFVKILREGLEFLFPTEQSFPIEKQLPLLQWYLLQHYCHHSPHRGIFTLVLYFRIYALRTDAANSIEILNLCTRYSQQNFLQALTDYRVDSLAHAAHLQLPVYKIEIERILKSLREIRGDRAEDTRLRNKNVVLSPSHIAELIGNFEFKLIRKEAQGGEDTFRKLPLFTKLLLQKWLAPTLFPNSYWTVANEWRKRHVKLDLQQHLLMQSCFLFCDVRHWSLWLQQAPFRNVDIFHVQDGAKFKDNLPKGKNRRLYVVLDEREGDQRNEVVIRQRLQEYISASSEGYIVILLSQKLHSAFHEVLRGMHKTADPDSVRAHCLEIYEFLQLMQHFQEGGIKEPLLEPVFPMRHDRKVSKAVIAEEKQLQLQMISRWNVIKKKTLNSHFCEVQRILMGSVIDDIQNSLIAASRVIGPDSLRAATAKLSIWQYPCPYQLQNHTMFFSEADIESTPAFQPYPIELLDSEEQLSSKRLHVLMGGLLKNRMVINGYFRNRLTSRFKENTSKNNPALNSKFKARPPVVLDEIQIRYVFEESQQRGEPNMIEDFRTPVRRLSRKRNVKSRISNVSQSQEDYQIEAFLLAKGRRLAQELQAAMDELISLWRTYEGERVLITGQHELRHAAGGDNFQQFFHKKYQGILQMALQMEEVVAVKEYKRPEILFKEEDLGLFLGVVRESSVLLLSPHYSDRRDCEAVLKCYDSERCQECLFLGKQRNGERVCLLIKQKIYELAYQSLLLVQDGHVPYVTLQTGFDVLQAKIYCRRIVSEIM